MSTTTNLLTALTTLNAAIAYKAERAPPAGVPFEVWAARILRSAA